MATTATTRPPGAKHHNKPTTLWGDAYDFLKSQDPDLVEKYEKILSTHLPGQSNTSQNLVASDPKERQAQMESIMKSGVERVDARKVRYRIGGRAFDLDDQVSEATDLLLSVRDWIAEAVKNSPEASLAWTGVSLVLVFLNNRSTALEAQKEGFRYVTSRLRFYIALESIMLPESRPSGIDGNLRDRYKDVVLELYVLVLTFQIYSVRRFYRGRLGNLGRDLVNADKWKDMLDKIKELEEELEKKSVHMNSAIARKKLSDLKTDSATMLKRLERQVELAEQWNDLFQQQVDAILEALNNQFDLLKQILSDKEMEKLDFLLQKLFVSDYESSKNRIEKRSDGTCQWFLEHPNYKQWLSQDSGALFVSADPGCGKSVLAKYLVDEALPRNATICYFFFKDPYATTAKQAVCSAVRQLLMEKPHLAHHALEQFRGVGEHLPERLNVVWKMLVNIVRDLDAGHIIWVVDALDECAQPELSDLISLIKGFFDSSKSKGGKFRILLTGRPYKSVTSKVDKALREFFPNIRIPGEDESEAIMEEVNKVIRRRVEKLSLKKDLREYLEARLLKIEHRTYLWVDLLFDYLENSQFKKTIRGISDHIDNFPTEVEKAYEKILSQVEENKKETVNKALSIILAAEHPLTLWEMNIALNITADTSGEDELDLEDENDFKNTIRDWCSLFVTIHNGRVTLIHQTAREYLLAESKKRRHTEALEASAKSWQHSIPLAHAHATLSISCVVYLNYLQLRGVRLERPKIKSVIKKHPFLEYACRRWASHIRDCGYVSDKIRHLYISICSPDQSLCKFWLKLCIELCHLHLFEGDGKLFRFYDRLSVEDLQPQTLPAYFGHLEGVKILEGSKQSQATRRGLSPFFAACWAGHSDGSVSIGERRQYGYDVQSSAYHQYRFGQRQDGEAMDREDLLPNLHYAATYLDLVYLENLLRKRGINIEARDKYGRTALHYARGAEKVLCLLKHGASIDAKDFQRQTPLFHPLGREGKKLLIERGADVHITDISERTTLHEARDAEEVSLLVSRGVPVDALDREGLTPLLYKTAVELLERAEYPLSGSIAALLEMGANPNVKDRAGITPLAAVVRAASHGRFALDLEADTIVSTLLKYGADPNIPDNHGLTPLCWASGGTWRSEMKPIVKILLDKGANVKSKDKLGRTPLHYACWNDREALTMDLLHFGADIHTTDWEGNSPLHFSKIPEIIKDYAIRKYGGIVVDLLHQAGAKFDAVNHCGMTPLLAAAANTDCLPWIEAVSEVESNILVPDDRGMTVLHCLAANARLGRRMWLFGSKVLNRLLETGAEAALETRDKEGRTPLFVAVSRANNEMIRILLERGAAVEAKDERGNTVLHSLSHSDPTSVREAAQIFYRVSTASLSQSRLSLDVRNNEGRTPLHEACCRGRAFLAEALVWAGADPEALDSAGYNPLQLVPETWREDMRGFVERGFTMRGWEREHPLYHQLIPQKYAPTSWPPELPPPEIPASNAAFEYEDWGHYESEESDAEGIEYWDGKAIRRK